MKLSLEKNKIRLKKYGKIIFVLFIIFTFVYPRDAKAALPSISGVGSSGITTVAATITWTTDIGSNSLVDYGETTSYGYTTGNTNESVTSHTVNLSGLNPGVSYKFRVRSTNDGDETVDNNGGAGYSFTTSAAAVISNVKIAEVTNSYVTVTWNTNVSTYPYVRYGNTPSYGQILGDQENSGTSHSITIAGFSANTTKYYRPRAVDLYGNTTDYGLDSTFTTGAPYLWQFDSTDPDGTYGPGDNITIRAKYLDGNGNNLGIGSTVTVLLNTGVQVTLDNIDLGNTALTGTYTVGATGLGENASDLDVSSIVSQNVCDSNNYCHTGLTMPYHSNLATNNDILVDTVAPEFSGVLPSDSSNINSVTTSSDLSYTLSESLNNATIELEWSSGVADPSSPHTCTLIEEALDVGTHNNFDTSDCQTGTVSLVDGAVYTINFNGQDLAGNDAEEIGRSNITFDTSEPDLQSLTSTTIDGTYGPASDINITATYNENIGIGSTVVATLDTGAQVTLDNIGAGSTSLTGTYTVGATDSGQNSSDLAVTSIDSHTVLDLAGNIQSGTGLPDTNIDDGSEIVIDTTAPNQPTLVNFITDPVNNSNKSNVTLRVEGDTGTTIYYSIDDFNNSYTNPVTGSIAMEGDGSTDVTGLDLSGLADSTITATVTLRDPAGNDSDSGIDTVIKNTLGPVFTIQYYSDSDLADSLGDNPRLKAGTYYLKISADEALNGTPTVDISAQGSNDVDDGATESVSGNDYKYTRTISYDVAADGTALENISVSGTDIYTNASTDVDPTNEADKAAYTDTILPTISSGTVTPNNAKAGAANVSLTFSENMNQSIAITAVITKSDLADLVITGNYTDATHWTGSATISQSDANGTATLKISDAEDLADNAMVDNNNVDTFIIDTANPSFTVNMGISTTSVQSDTINISVSDSGGSGLLSQHYGFSADSDCDASDPINTAFISGADFNITGDHSDYLCVKAEDNAGNIGYQTIGQLHVDNSAPYITDVSSNHADGHFKAGEIIDIDLTFSEIVTSDGSVIVTLNTGRTCSFSVLNAANGSCDYTVQDGDTSSDLDVQTISGDITDQAGNDMSNFVPSTNLAGHKEIVIDTTAPTVNITSPLAGNRVKDNAIVIFSDNEVADPECSIDDSNWVDCESESTAMSALTGWGGLGDGNFTLYLRDTDAALNIGTDSEVNVIKDTSPPTISGVTSNHADGIFKAGETIDIIVNFSEIVTSDGSVIVTLNTGRTCSFSVLNAANGSCDYTVQDGDTSSDLDVQTISGDITDQAGNDMSNFVPSTNLAGHKEIVIDTTAPTILNVNSDSGDGAYVEEDSIDIDIYFSEEVTSTGFVTVTLDTGGSCTFTVDHDDFGTCDYQVGLGENSSDLTVSSISGTIRDQAQNLMTNSAPATNLAANKNIQIDTTPPGRPTITNINSDHNDGSFNADEAINIDLTFSENVTSTGFVTVTLDTGGTCTFIISGTDNGSCIYTVGAGETSGDLDVQSVAGTIRDQAGNAMNNYNPATNLAYNKAIIIDTTAPESPVVTLTDPITELNKDAVSITGTGEVNAVVNYSINDTNPLTSPVTGTGLVDGSGDINVTGIDLSSLDGGTITASVTLTDAAGNVGTAGMDTATSEVVRPGIVNVTSNHLNGSFKAGESISINVTFSENVTSTGSIIVTLDSGGSCSFTIDNSDSGTCNYSVASGHNSSDLEVSSIFGVIHDQTGNVLLDFAPQTNLAENKDIVIDTISPSTPSITLTEPINDSNRNAASITGTGEADAIITYSVDDSNPLTSAVTGSGVAEPNGTIIQTGINLSSLDGGTITASVILTDVAGNISLPGTDTATSTVVKPTIASVSSSHANGSFKAGESISIDVTFSENVTSTGDVTVTLETGNTDRTCVFTVDNSITASCYYTVQDGDSSGDLDVQSVSGTIADQGGNSMVNFTPDANLAGSKAIVIDTTAPVLNSFTSSTTNSSYGPASSINVTANFDGNLAVGSTMTVQLNTGAQIALANISGSTLYGAYSVGATGSGEDTTDLSVASIISQNTCDLAGNCQAGTSLPTSNISDTSQIAIDTTAPIFSNVLPNSSSNIDNVTSSSDISYSISESLASATITITRTAWAEDSYSPHTCTLTGTDLVYGDHDNFDTTNCQEGAVTLVVGAMYSFDFQATDLYDNASGHQTRTGITFGLDEEGPVISDVSAEVLGTTSATITWATDEASNSLVDFGTTASYGITEGNSDDNTANHSVTINDLTPGETYLFRVRSRDENGYETVEDNGGEGYELTTLSLATISNIEEQNLTDTTIEITWDSNSTAYSYIDYGTTTSYGRIVGDEETLTQSHSITLAGLTPNTTYYYRPRIKDIDGNYSLGSGGDFTTQEEDTGTGDETETDNNAPSISGVKASKGQNASVVINWSTDKETNGMVRFGLNNEYGQSAAEDATVDDATNFATDHEVNLTNLLSNTKYHFAVVSYDASGNIGISGDKTFTTDALSSISSVKVTDVKLDQATIVWETASPTTSSIDYGLSVAYGRTKNDSVLENMHKMELTGLEAGKTYHFRVNGVSKSDNAVSSDDYIFATNPEPILLTHSFEEITDSRVTVIWKTNVQTDSSVEYASKNNAEDQGLQGMPDYTTEHKVVLNGLNQGTEYEIKIRGIDINKNTFESDPYAVATIKDENPPEISQVNTESSLISGKDENVQSIILWKTNELSTSQVIFDTKRNFSDNSSSQQSRTDTNLSTNHVVVLTNLKQGAVYYFRVISRDKNNNEAQSADFSLLTPQKEKSVIQLIISNFEQTFGWMRKMKL